MAANSQEQTDWSQFSADPEGKTPAVLSPACPAPLTDPSPYVSPAVAAGVVSAEEMAATLAELNKPEHRGKNFIPMPPHLVGAANRMELWGMVVENRFLH